ncbi:CopG-like RHH_1 or ribbon-helix-helix domain-containing protein, RHH_5 [Persephonella hydrogeniphila]|uniref:CopG-like RHH_1 or ribbon-helix-helix domain-containing protein, RHH_5 n=1 Tax=Persephonella hydrogeniphila TaxID=198703 RepID=A0A285N4G6_9AQUI|nr:HNH endonuclease [Persephonella hydrogeniphila]SNZ03717.1 CopG-like RHH_1 or ribbon-helix-helix domain-containing protein, RHH_5 [Persephonella hydrogeniphila]
MKGKFIYRFDGEILKQIEDFPDYAISNKGFVYRGLKYGLLPDSYKQFRMKTFKNKKGFHTIQLSNRGKKKLFYVHRLVGEYFVENKEGKKYLVHIDGNKDNNSADNLKWVSSIRKEKKLKKTDKRDILTVSINPEVKEKLFEIAEKKGKTVSSMVEELLKRYLEEEE